MFQRNKYGNIDSYVVSQARFYLNRLIINGCYSSYEREDLFQEFIMCYLKHKDSYDSDRSSFKVYISFTFQNLYRELALEIISRKQIRNVVYYDPIPKEENKMEYQNSLTAVSPFLCPQT